MSFSFLTGFSDAASLNFDTVNFLTTALTDVNGSVSGANGVLTFAAPAGTYSVGNVMTFLMAGAPPPNDASNIYVAAPDGAGGALQHYAIPKSQTIGEIFFIAQNTSLNNDFGFGGSDPTLGSIFGQSAVDLIAPSIAADLDGSDLDDVMTLPTVGGFLSGDIGNDSLTGSAFGDTIFGEYIGFGTGNDTIYGLGGDDILFAGLGSDVIYGGMGHDTITSGSDPDSNNDTLFGEGGNDHITVTGIGTALGGDGNDTIRGELSTEISYGGFAAASFVDAPLPIYANLTGIFQGGISGGSNATGFLIDDGFGTQDNIAGVHVLEASLHHDVIMVDASFANNFGNWLEIQPGGGDDTITATGLGTARVSYREMDSAVLGDLQSQTATDLIAGTDVIGMDVFSGINEFLGSNEGDQIFGFDGDDKRIRGNDGDDYIDGRNGTNLLEGERGNDTLVGGTGEDTLRGGDGDDSLVAGDDASLGFDELSGGAGDDYLSVSGQGYAQGDAGNDTIDAFTIGNDFAIAGYAGDPSGIIVNLTAGVRDGVLGGDVVNGFLIRDGYGDTDLVRGIHTVRGSEHNDNYYVDSTFGNSFGNWIEIRPQGGDDYVEFDGVSTSMVSYRSTTGPVLANLELGTATDLIGGNNDIGMDTFTGATRFRGSQGDDSIIGSLGDDHLIRGHDGGDTIQGRSGNDSIRGENGADSIDGGTGEDQISGGEGNDTLDGGAPDGEVFDLLYGDNGNDVLTIQGIGGMSGDLGNDTLLAVSDGNPNTFSYTQAAYDRDPGGIIANLTTTAQAGVSGGSMANGYSVRDGYGDTDNVTGVYAFIGSFFDDLFFADASYFTSARTAVEFAPGGGDDAMVATGVGFFSINYFGLYSGLIADLDAGTATDIVASDNVIGMDTFTRVDQFRATSAADQIYGSSMDDAVLFGDAGNDLIDGRSGSDNMEGSDGFDTLVSGIDADTLNGGNDDDLGSYRGSDARVEINLAFGTADGGYATGDNLISIENLWGSDFNDLLVGGAEDNDFSGWGGVDNINGRAGDDSLFGDDGDDLISGGLDNDTVNGGADNDRLLGNGGDDQVFGEDGQDSLFGGIGNDLMDAGSGNDSVLGQGNNDTILGQSGDDTLRGGSGNDSIEGGDDDDDLFGQGNNDTIHGGEGNDSLQGNPGADQLFGGAGDDSLFGGAAGDRLDGGTGNDLMNGGTNDGVRDVFVYLLGYDQDRINQFDQAGTDRLELDTDLWAAMPGLTAQQAVDMFGNMNTAGNILTLDFGDGDVLEVQSSAGIDQTTFGLDILLV